MNLFFVMIRKEFQQILRDKTSLRLMLLMPMVQMFVLGYALTTEVKNTPIAILNHDGSPQSQSLVQTISHHHLFHFLGYAQSESQLRSLLDQGKIKLGLIIPTNFALNLEQVTKFQPGQVEKRNTGAKLQLWVDGQDANSAGVARGYLSSILNQWAMYWMGEKLKAMGLHLEQLLPVSIQTTVVFNPMLKSTWYMIPGIAVILVTMVTALLTGFSIVREKEAGTLEQLLVTPIKPIHIIIGKTLPFFFIGVFELLLALAMAQIWFHVPFRGSYFALIIFSSAYMLSSLGIGIFTSTVARTQQQALFIIWFFLLFFLLLSGFFMPVENMPHWVQKITYLNPVRYFMLVLREMFLKGSGFTELWREGLSMFSIGLVVFTLAILKFNRRLN